MAESENLPRWICIRLKGPAGPETAPGAALDGDQCSKPIHNACKRLKRKITAADDDGIQASSDAKRFARSAKIPDLNNKNTTLSPNSLQSSSQKQEIECGRPGGSKKKLPSGLGKQKQFNPDTLFRLIRCDTPTKGRKRSQSSLGMPTSSQLKRSKRSSEERTSSINNLPDVVLVEILCRLPCSKFVFQCKSVSKRWHTLIIDPYFIGRFVTTQSYKKTREIRTLINERAEEFLPEMSPSPKIPPFLERVKSFHRLMRDLIVVATYNDLVLCCTTEYYQRVHYQRDYFICNVCTMQSVALPRPPSRHKYVRVGLICDLPYYECKKDDWEGHNIQLNAEYRCKVVRVLSSDDSTDHEKCDSFILNVEIFSFETGEWKETIVSSPRRTSFLDCFSIAYNAMLYWSGDGFFILGLDPFNDNNPTSSSSSNSDGDHKLRLTVFEKPMDEGVVVVKNLGVCGGCVRMCNFRRSTRSLYVWELKEQDRDQMVNGDAGKLCLSKCSIYPLDRKMFRGWRPTCILNAFDPNNEEILYLDVDKDIMKCNIRTRKWSKIVEKCPESYGHYFPVVLPWWPTPVPRLAPRHARN